MKRFFVVFSCFISTIAFIGCTEPIGEQTLVGTLDSVPYYADDYSPHFGYQFADWFFHWAPTIKTEDGTEYIITRNMFSVGAPAFDCDTLVYNPICIWAGDCICEGDTITVTGSVRKRYYAGRKFMGIEGGIYLWIVGNDNVVNLVRHGVIYDEYVKPMNKCVPKSRF